MGSSAAWLIGTISSLFVRPPSMEALCSLLPRHPMLVEICSLGNDCRFGTIPRVSCAFDCNSDCCSEGGDITGYSAWPVKCYQYDGRRTSVMHSVCTKEGSRLRFAPFFVPPATFRFSLGLYCT